MAPPASRVPAFPVLYRGSFVTALLWAAEWALETLGAYYALRMRIFPLSAYLGFRAASDIAIFLIRQNCGDYAYAWAYWAQCGISALLLCWLCCSVVARMMADRHYTKHAAVLAFIVSMAAVVGIFKSDSLAQGLLNGTLNMDAAMGIIFMVALLSKKTRLDAQWQMITWAICIHLGWDGLVRGAGHLNESALAWLPIGAIVALVIWIAAVSRRVEEVSYFRLDSIGSPNAEPLSYEEAEKKVSMC